MVVVESDVVWQYRISEWCQKIVSIGVARISQDETLVCSYMYEIKQPSFERCNYKLTFMKLVVLISRLHEFKTYHLTLKSNEGYINYKCFISIFNKKTDKLFCYFNLKFNCS